jgi:hypothetical protein
VVGKDGWWWCGGGGGDASEPEPRSQLRGATDHAPRSQAGGAYVSGRILIALASLSERYGEQAFTVREVYAEMLAHGTSYAETTLTKTVQRMKGSPTLPPHAPLEGVGRAHFRLAGVAT